MHRTTCNHDAVGSVPLYQLAGSYALHPIYLSNSTLSRIDSCSASVYECFFMQSIPNDVQKIPRSSPNPCCPRLCSLCIVFDQSCAWWAARFWTETRVTGLGKSLNLMGLVVLILILEDSVGLHRCIFCYTGSTADSKLRMRGWMAAKNPILELKARSAPPSISLGESSLGHAHQLVKNRKFDL